MPSRMSGNSNGGVALGRGIARVSPVAVLVVLMGMALTGCFGGKASNARCDDVAEYQLARSVPLLVAPDGLLTPSHSSSYTIPPPGASPEVDGAACLSRPPDYFKTPVVGPAASPPANPLAPLPAPVAPK